MAMSKLPDVKSIDPGDVDDLGDLAFSQMANAKIRAAKHEAHGLREDYRDHEYDFGDKGRKQALKRGHSHGPAAKKFAAEKFA